MYIDLSAFLPEDEYEELLEDSDEVERNKCFNLKDVMSLPLPLHVRVEIVCKAIMGPHTGGNMANKIFKKYISATRNEPNTVAAMIKQVEIAKEEVAKIMERSNV